MNENSAINKNRNHTRRINNQSINKNFQPQRNPENSAQRNQPPNNNAEQMRSAHLPNSNASHNTKMQMSKPQAQRPMQQPRPNENDGNKKRPAE